MKKILFSFCLLFSFVACNDSEDYVDQTPEKAFNSDTPNKNYSGNISHPFFEVDYVQNELGIKLNRVVSSTKVYDVMNQFSELSYIDKLVIDFEAENLFPCWSCAETDYHNTEDISIVLTPVMNITSGEVRSIIVQRDNGTETILNYIDENLLQEIYLRIDNTAENETFSYSTYNYYFRFVEYFQLLKNNKNPDINNYRFFKDGKGCRKDSATGWCECEAGIACDGIPQTGPCHKGTCPTGGGGPQDEELDAGDSSSGGPSPLPPINPGSLFGDWAFDFGSDPPGGVSSTGGTTISTLPYDNDYGITPPPINPFTKLLLIEDLINYINTNTQIELTANELSTIGNLANFDLLIWPLLNWLNNSAPPLTEIDLDFYINFITNHPNFIQSVNESIYLMSRSGFTNTLDSWLLSHNDELGKNLGHFIRDTYDENNLSGGLRKSFMQLSQAYSKIDNFDLVIENINAFVNSASSGEVTTKFNLFVNGFLPAIYQIQVTGTPGIEINEPYNSDPYQLSSIYSEFITPAVGLTIEQIALGEERVLSFMIAEEWRTYYEVDITYKFKYGLDFVGIPFYYPWRMLATPVIDNFTGEGVDFRSITIY